MDCNQQEEKTANLKISFYDSIHALDTSAWEKFTTNKDIYWSKSYLEVLEKTLKGDVKFYYALFHNAKNDLLAVAYFQLAKFIDHKANYKDNICLVPGVIKSTILKRLEVNILVCGNVFACGEYGFSYSSQLSPTVAYSNLARALEQFKASKQNKDYSIVLLKEYWESTTVYSHQFLEKGYYDFKIDVNMVLKIHSKWKNMNDYLQSMTTKYRTRANGVFKKSKDLLVKSFEPEDIMRYEHRINELYGFVLEKSDFNFGKITAQSFIGFKTNLKDNFSFMGYFLDDVLIGFSTAMTHHKMMDANFVGLDYLYNNKYALYQRMLYDFVERAITENLVEIRLGRTAEEIKSCLGAEPMDMELYVKHKNAISNKVVKSIIKTVKPSSFKLHQPFKANFN